MSNNFHFEEILHFIQIIEWIKLFDIIIHISRLPNSKTILLLLQRVYVHLSWNKWLKILHSFYHFIQGVENKFQYFGRYFISIRLSRRCWLLYSWMACGFSIAQIWLLWKLKIPSFIELVLSMRRISEVLFGCSAFLPLIDRIVYSI